MWAQDEPGLLIEGVVIYPEFVGGRWMEAPVQDGAVWIEGGRVRAVGPREALRAAAGPAVRRLDGQGALAVPGLVDSHLHLGEWALSRTQADLSRCRRIHEVVEALKRQARQLPPPRWLVARGLSPHGMQEDPQRDLGWLDAAFPDRPVVIWTRDLHSVLLNRAARLAAGIGPGFDAWPPGSVAPRDPQTGDWVGVFREKAVSVVEQSIPRPSLAERVEAVERWQGELLRLGLTGLHAPEGPETLAALSLLHQRGGLRLRVRFLPPAAMLGTLRAAGLRQGFGDEQLRLGPIKAFADGSLGSLTAALEAPYTGVEAASYRGELLLDREAVAELAREAAEAGFALAVHAIGDRACREVLDGLEEAARRGAAVPRFPHRIEHAQLLSRHDAGRMGRLGVVASMQPIHLAGDREPAERYWAGRTQGAYAARWLAEAGAVLAFGSDAPVAEPDPLQGLYAAVTRLPPPALDDAGPPAPDVPWHPEQALSVVEALQAYTHGPALAVGEGGQAGRLAPGMAGDVVLLAPDVVALERRLGPGAWVRAEGAEARAVLARARVLATVVGGQVLYTA